MKFSSIENVIKIEVRSKNNELIKTIDTLDEIKKIMSFINARLKGWRVPLAGVPIPIVVADIYNTSGFQGHFGVGVNFFEIHRDDGFYSQRANEQERKEFISLLGISYDILKRN